MIQRQVTPNHFYNTRVVYFDHHGLVVTIQECRRHHDKGAEPTTFQILERFVNFEVSSKFFLSDGASLPITKLIEKIDSGELSFNEANTPRTVAGDRLIIHYDGWKVQIQIWTHCPKGNIRAEDISTWLNNIPVEIIDYLLARNPRGPEFNFVPAGFGWNGKHTHLDLFYMFKMRQLLIGTWRWDIDLNIITSLSEQYMQSPTTALKTDWRKAEIHSRGATYTIGDINPQSEVYVFFQNDKHSFHDTSIDRETHSFVMPEGYDRAIVVVTNCVVKNSRQTGLAILLYKETFDV